MSEWTSARLGDVMALDVETVDVEPEATYPVVGVLNRGRGLLYRDPLHGSETKYKSLNRIRPGQVVYSRLKAFEGAITVAPEALSEAYASQEFPTFTCGPRLLPAYFALLATSPGLWDDLQKLSTGMGGRRERVKPSDFLTVSLTLPCMPEQRRIVDLMAALDEHIEALADEVARAEVTYKNSSGLLWLSSDGAEATKRPLSDVMKLEVLRLRLEPEAIYRGAGVLNAGKGLIDKGRFRGRDTEYQTMNVLRTDQVVMRKLTAWEGPITVVPDSFDGRVASSEFPTFTLGHEISPDWMRHVCRTERLWQEMKNRVTGSVQRRKRLNPDQLLGVVLPMPPIDSQRRTALALDAVLSCAVGAADELTRLRAFRSSLLTPLLNQDIEIPESYDDLLEAAS